ncbi:MAG TPA: FAD-binding domain [Roseiarcus sp.]|nr:FAD-binding domain [Roseiarcus sp.]
MPNKTILISGLGIAGPTLAYWLKAAGFEPTIVERAPAPRRGGYVIDFWGLGYDVAERMGLIGDIERNGYHVRGLRVVDDHGRRLAGFGTRVLREITGGRYVTIGRSDLSSLLFEKVRHDVETVFDDEIVALDQQDNGVDVELRRGGRRRFHHAIGADGLHSAVRRLVFGPQDRFEKPLGQVVAAFEVCGYRPRDEDVFVIHSEPGRMLARFAMHEDRTLFLLVFAAGPELSGSTLSLAAQKAVLHERFGGGRWECSNILAELDRAQDLYFDRVSQIRLDRWVRGRVALVGDAAFCVSFLGGQGAALAMTSAYVLAGELMRANGRHEEAFRRYETQLKAFVAAKQRTAERFGRVFAPRTNFGLFLRNQIIKACALPGLAKLTFARNLVDTLKLPNYAFGNAIVNA